jgi:hypothetical protein
MKNVGSMNVYTQKGSERHVNNVGWDVDYDGEIADVDLVVSRDGDTRQVSTRLNNDDIDKLLDMPVVSKSLDERLTDDYLIDKRVYRLSPVSPHHVLMKKKPGKKKIKVVKLKTRKRKRRKLSRSKSKSKSKSRSRSGSASSTSTKRGSRGKKSTSSKKASSSSLSRRTPRPKTKRIHLTTAPSS